MAKIEQRGEFKPWYFTRRALACCLDYGLFYSLFFAYLMYFGTEVDGQLQVHGCSKMLLPVLVWVLLFWFPESMWGRTFGKWCFGLQLKGVNGAEPTMGQCFLRRLMDIIDIYLAFGLVAFIVAKNTPLRQRVGDFLGKTRVVEETSRSSPAPTAT